jgi:hypothetical protein
MGVHEQDTQISQTPSHTIKRQNENNTTEIKGTPITSVHLNSLLIGF